MIIMSTVSPALKIGLRSLGMWPDVSYPTVHWLSFMLSLLIMQYLQYLYVFEHLNISDLPNLVDSLSVALDFSLTFVKMISLWIHRRVLHHILVIMDNDWRESINIDQHLYMMTVKANLSHFCSNAILSISLFVGIFYLSSEYVIQFIFRTEDYNDTLRQFPLRVQFPFESQQSPMFEFLVVTIFIQAMLHVYTIATLNGLFFTLVFHVSGQIDIICQELKIISKNILLHESSISSFGMLIERHNRVISFSENIENLFSFFALMQVVWNTLVICCLGFVIIISIHNETGIFVLMKTVFGYLTIMMEAFVICFAGEYLTLKGKLIANATYETVWYNMSSSKGKIIMFIIMRSQKRLTITAGKMMDMSFKTFTNIVKASASYISVLNALY